MQVWIADIASLNYEELPLNKYLALLSPPELKKFHKIVKPQKKLAYLMGRNMLKIMLAPLIGSNPVQVIFDINSSGRPELKNTPENISFNLSHTENLIVCVVATSKLGVDCEHLNKSKNISTIAKTYFSKDEFKFLQTKKDKEKNYYFYLLWTLKEAYLKNQSLGIFDLNKEISFEIDNSVIKFSKDKNINFISFQPQENYLASIALENHKTPDQVEITYGLPHQELTTKKIQVLFSSEPVEDMTKIST